MTHRPSRGHSWRGQARFTALKDRPLVRNVLRLAAAGLVGRAVDSTYRVFVARAVGPEAMGLVQMTAPMYGLAYALATLALAPVLARLSAAAPRGDRSAARLHLAALALGTFSGIGASLLLAALAGPVASHWLADARTVTVLRLLTLALVPAGLSAVQRGWLYGHQRAKRIATAQIAEPTTRALVVGAIVLLSPPRTVPGLAAALAAGTVAGEFTELLALYLPNPTGLAHSSRKPHGPAPAPSPRRSRPRVNLTLPRAQWSLFLQHHRELPKLLGLSTPLLLNQLAFSAASAVEASVIPRRLALGGLSVQQTTRLYGQLYGMGMPLVFMPMMLVAPVTSVLLPALSEAQDRGDRRSINRTIRRAALAIACIAALTLLVLTTFPGAVSRLMRGGPELAPLVRLLGLWAPLAYADMLGSTILIALGRPVASLNHGLAGSMVRLVIASALVARPDLGISGAVWGFIAGDAMCVALHWRSLAPLFRR